MRRVYSATLAGTLANGSTDTGPERRPSELPAGRSSSRQIEQAGRSSSKADTTSLHNMDIEYLDYLRRHDNCLDLLRISRSARVQNASSSLSSNMPVGMSADQGIKRDRPGNGQSAGSNKKRRKEQSQDYKCTFCSFTAFSKTLLNRHTRSCHVGDKVLSCRFCPLRTAKKRKISSHMLEHTADQQQYACPFCPITCKSKYGLKRHFAMHTGDQSQYACPICPVTCKTKYAMKRHSMLHTGKRPFQCSLCAFTGVRKDSIKYHMRSHKDGKPMDKASIVRMYECPLCSFKDHIRTKFSLHMRHFHSGTRPNTCKFCLYEATSPHDLTVHMRTHQGRKSYIFDCNACPYRSRTLVGLRNHAKTHKINRPYPPILSSHGAPSTQNRKSSVRKPSTSTLRRCGDVVRFF